MKLACPMSPIKRNNCSVILFLLLLLAATTAQAQEGNFWEKANQILTKRADVDTTCIYQPRSGFSLGVFTTGQKAGFDVDFNFHLTNDEGISMPGSTVYSLSENLCMKIGLEAGYGNVILGYGFEVGPRSAEKKRSFALNVIGRSWGMRLNYYNISNTFKTSFEFGNEGDEHYWHGELIANELTVLRSFSIDGYYAFNNKRFAYPATYKVGLVQRHTAGSWMLTARYMQGSLYNSPEEALSTLNLLDCFSTIQASVGGGYSVNFVLWHKDPTGKRDQGLRNLTLNMTAMPVITLFNYLKTTAYEYDDDFNHCGEKVAKVLCKPMPNFIGSAALGFTWNRFFFSTQFTYNWFYFRSRDAFDANQFEFPNYDLDDIHFKGTFHDWTLKGILVYKF